MGTIESRVLSLAQHLRNELDAIAGVYVRDVGSKQCGIVTFDCNGVDAESVMRILAGSGVHVTCATVFSTRLDMEARGLPAVVRASIHYYNTESEIRSFIAKLRRILSELQC